MACHLRRQTKKPVLQGWKTLAPSIDKAIVSIEIHDLVHKEIAETFLQSRYIRISKYSVNTDVGEKHSCRLTNKLSWPEQLLEATKPS